MAKTRDVPYKMFEEILGLFIMDGRFKILLKIFLYMSVIPSTSLLYVPPTF